MGYYQFKGNCRYCGVMGHKAKDCKKRKMDEARKKNGTATSTMKCNHCGKSGHTEETCWKKHPYLKNIVCSYCGKKGHKAKDCLKKKKADLNNNTTESNNDDVILCVVNPPGRCMPCKDVHGSHASMNCEIQEGNNEENHEPDLFDLTGVDDSTEGKEEKSNMSWEYLNDDDSNTTI